MHRRHALLTLLSTSFGVVAGRGLAKPDVIALDWGDLVPDPDFALLMKDLRELGVINHGELSSGFEQEKAEAVTQKFNGSVVRIPGFVVPLDLTGQGITMFILAPFVGACIHVPPPPANQLILVTTETPYEYDGLFDPVEVTGIFDTASASTPLADIGYIMTAQEIAPFDVTTY